jgi:hypothetical protein
MRDMSEAYGDCYVHQLYDSEGGITLVIGHADPVIRISPGMLAEIPHPPSDHHTTYDAAARVLRIEGANRTVVYRIREMLEERPGARGYFDYIGEWPD